MSGGSTPQQPTQTTKAQISPEAQALFNTAYPALTQFAANPPKAYPGTTVAPTTPTQTAARQDILGGATAAGDIADWSRTGAQNLTASLSPDVAGTTPFVRTPLTTSSDIFSDPGIWNPAFNTGTNDAIMAATRPLYQQLTEQALPAIRTAVGPGPTSTRQGIAEGLATGRTAQAASDVGKKIVEDLYGANLNAVNQRYATNIAGTGQRYATDVGAETARYGTDIGAAGQRYGQNINAELAAFGLAPSLQQQQLIPGVTGEQVGELEQQQRQAEINAEVARYNYNQWAPFMTSAQIMSMIQGLPGTSVTSTGNVPTTPMSQQITGGALSGAAAGAALGSVVPGIGTLAGAGIGAVGGGTLPFLFRA
jgi:hypothetical protein